MRRAVSERSISASEQRPVQTETWYCDPDQQLKFLRSVNVLGDKYRTGLACDEQELAPDVRFYAEDMFSEDTHCVFVAYDVTTKRHRIE